MFTLKGLVILILAFISYRIVIPISIFISFFIVANIKMLHLGITLITLAIMLKVFFIFFPSKEKYEDRFFFIPTEIITPILLVFGTILSVISFFIK